MTFFVCSYLLLRFLTTEYFVFIKGEKKKLKEEKKNYEHEIEDDKSTLRQVDNAEKLNKHIEPKDNHPYKDLKEFYPEFFKDDSASIENLKRLKEALKQEVADKQEIIAQLEREIENVTPTPSDPPESPSTPPANPVSDDSSEPSISKKRKTPSDFIDDLPSEFPSFMDIDD